MTFEGFDAILPLASGPDLTGGQLALPSDMGTLDEALRAVAPGRPLTLSHPDDLLERTGLLNADLWVSPGLVKAQRIDAAELESAQLRELTSDELELVAGGRITDFYEQHVFVTGERYFEPDWGWMYDFNSWYGDVLVDGGGGGQSNEHQQTEDADETPCVDQLPDGVDLNHLNDLAKFMGTQIAALQEATDHEWGAVIYRAADGQLYQSDPFTAGLHDRMDGATFHLPPGAVVVAYLHTHPNDDTMDERTLSDDDRQFISGLIQNGIADTDMLAYIVTKDNSTQYHTYVYDKSKRTSTSPGCDL